MKKTIQTRAAAQKAIEAAIGAATIRNERVGIRYRTEWTRTTAEQQAAMTVAFGEPTTPSAWNSPMHSCHGCKRWTIDADGLFDAVIDSEGTIVFC